MKLKPIVFVTVLTLSGCMNYTPIWPIVDLTNKDPQAYNNDISACWKNMFANYGPNYLQGDFMQKCLQSKGYVLIK